MFFALHVLFAWRANMAKSAKNGIQLAFDRALDGLAVVEAVETKDDVARVLIRGRTRSYGAFLSKRGVTRRWREVSDERGPHRAADR
jgi:hypothetical protein